jgi:hypothetical protein
VDINSGFFDYTSVSYSLSSSVEFPAIIRVIKSRRMRWVEHVEHMFEMRNAYKMLVGNLEGKEPLGRSGRRWEDNIKMDLREKGLEGLNWIHLTQDRDRWRALVNTVMNLRDPLKAGNILTISGTISFSSRTLFHEVSFVS